MNNSDQPSAYDSNPYASGAYAESHPDLLSGIGRLFGLDTPDPEHCRILEFGCADGSNLLPMACELPGSEFVGVDLSQTQIEVARDAVREAGIKNAEFHAGNLVDAGAVLDGKFDYILAHGLYSWVPDSVKKKLLELSKEYLSPNGVAYISYNTLPGWRPLQAIREMMLYHSSAIDDESQKSSQSRALINFLANSVPEDDPYGLLLKTQSQQFTQYSDAYFTHDWLESDNDPLYFHQFIDAVNREGLQYLGDAILPTMFAPDLPAEVVQTLKGLSTDQVRFEQYADFVRNRRFRHSLITHADQQVSHDLKSARLDSLYLRSVVSSRSSDDADEFQSRKGGEVKVQNDIGRMLLNLLVETYPDSIRFSDLKNMVDKNLEVEVSGEETQEGADINAVEHSADDKATHLLLDAVVRGLLEVSGRQFAAGSSDDEFPRAHAYAKYQAKNSFDVTNRFHITRSLDPVAILLIRHLDGKTGREALVDVLAQAIKSGDISLEEGEKTMVEKDISSEMLLNLVDEGIKTLENTLILSRNQS